ncbi:MAG: hypothetical protein FJ405_04245 [Verrucomicrobia bacterium]|nr:hypothetical protein [Verrucomicrobiota bacterium]
MSVQKHIGCLVVGCLAWVGCKTSKPDSTPAPAAETQGLPLADSTAPPPPASPAPPPPTVPAIVAPGGVGRHELVAGSEVVGKVTTVNTLGKFVVLSFPVGVMPAVGASLEVFRDGVKCGEVKVTGPQRDTFIVADVLKGTLQINDEVRQP